MRQEAILHRYSPRGFLSGLLLLAALPLQAADYNWTEPASGNWNNPANWGGTAPTSADNASIDNGGTALLPTAVSGSYSELRVGTTSGGVGTINIEGGSLSGTTGYLGYQPGGSGSATVTSGTWINSGALSVGHSDGESLHQWRLRFQ